MAAAPDVSIVVPVYRRELLVREAVASALAQTHENVEVVVVDNASPDATVESVREVAGGDPRVRLFVNDENLGPVRNWKRGIELARAEFVKVLFSDDWMDPRFVEATLPVLKGAPDAGFVFTPARVHGDGREWLSYDRYRCDGLRPLREFVEGHLFGDDELPVSPGCALFRRDDLLRNLLVEIPNDGGYRFADHGAGPDLLLYLLCHPGYRSFGFVREPLSHFRWHPGCISADPGISLHYLLSKRYFVDTAAPEYRDRFYSRLFLRSLSGKPPYARLLEGVSYRKEWRFIAREALGRQAKKISRKIRKIRKIRRVLGASAPD